MRFLKLPIALLCLGYSLNSFAEVNIDESSDIQAEQLQSISRLSSLQHLNTSTYQLPQVQVLANTVPTFFVQSPSLSMVDVQINFNAGSSRDEEIGQGLIGLANSTARLMNEGTPKYNAEQLALAFENLGVQVSFSASRDVFSVKLRSLSDAKTLDRAVELMLHVLNEATFAQSSVTRMVENNKVGQKQLQENPSRLLGIAFNRAIYAKHPYAEPTTGTLGSMQKIKPADMHAFREKFLVRENANIAITGQLNTKQATALANTITQSLNKGQKASVLPSAPLQEGIKIQHLSSNSTQAHVIMGHVATTRHDPDRLALQVANRMLGSGGFNSILMQELRVKRGYTYGASSSFSFSQATGSFSLSYSTRQDQLMDSILVAHKALVDFVNQPIDAKQLADTKAGMLLAFPRTLASNADINSQLAALGFHGESKDYLQQYSQALEKIDARQVQDAVRRWIHPDRLTVMVASQSLDKEALKRGLEANLKP
jgi:zinc protease